MKHEHKAAEMDHSSYLQRVSIDHRPCEKVISDIKKLIRVYPLFFFFIYNPYSFKDKQKDKQIQHAFLII